MSKADGEWMTWGSILATVFMVHGFVPQWINQVVPGGWSVGVEMCFYLIVPFLHSKLRTMDRVLWFGFAALVVSRGTSLAMQCYLGSHYPDLPLLAVHEFTLWWLPHQLPVFVLGFVAYFLLTKRPDLPPAAEPTSPAGLPRSRALLCLLAAVYLSVSYAATDPTFFLPGTEAAMFLVCLGLARYPFRGLVNPVFCFLGKISFGVYLFHFAALTIVHDRLGPRLAGPWPIQVVMLWTTSLIVVVTVATLGHYLVELPAQGWGKRLIARLEASR